MHICNVFVFGENGFRKYFLVCLFEIVSLCGTLSTTQATELTCHDAYKIIQFALSDRRHLIYHKLNPKLIHRTMERFTNKLLEVFFIVLTKEDREKIKVSSRKTDPTDVLKQLQKEDCRYFESQMNIVHAAVENAQIVFSSVNRLSTDILQYGLRKADQYELVPAKNVMRKFASIESILSRDEAALTASYWFLHWLGQLNLRSKTPYIDLLKGFAEALDPNSKYLTELEARNLYKIDHPEIEPNYSVSAVFAAHPYGVQVTKVPSDSKAQGFLSPGTIIYAVNEQIVIGFGFDEILDLITKKEPISISLAVGKIQEGRLISRRNVQIPLEKVNFEKLIDSDQSEEDPYERKNRHGISIVIIKLAEFSQNSAANIKHAIEMAEKEKHIDALILDLRSNPGGFLEEANQLMGDFLTQGPVGKVISRSSFEVEKNFNLEKTYSGPLVIAINDATASAAELVAATLKTVNRALIVGGTHSYGKGTYQNTYYSKTHPDELVQGAFTITKGRFYAIDGSSPQKTGVFSQIEVPGPNPDEEDEAKDQKYPIPKISPLLPFFTSEQLREDMDPELKFLIPLLTRRSRARVAHDEEFQAFSRNKIETTDFQLREIENITADYAIYRNQFKKLP